MKKKWRKFFTVLVLFGLTLLSLVCLSGCQSTDQSEFYMNYPEYENIQVKYISETDETKVSWKANFNNNTIYYCNGVSITVELFRNSQSLGEKSYDYDFGIKNGDEYSCELMFHVKGEIDAVRIAAWTPKLYSFWDTYKIWIIVTIVVTIIAAVGIVVAIIMDWEIPCFVFIGLLIVITFASWIFAAIVKYWVIALIVGAGILIVAIAGGMTYFIVEGM